MSRLVRTILADRNDLFREGLRRILSGTDFRVVKLTATLDDIRPSLLERLNPGLLLLNMGPDDSSAALGVRQFKKTCPAGRVVVLCERCDLDEILLVLGAGADGIILKQTDPGRLIKSLHLVMLGETVLPSMAARLLARLRESPGAGRYPAGKAFEADEQREMDKGDHAPRRLSDREEEILECLTRGEANKLIARRFDITEATVKVHIKAILRKISVKNRTQAAIWAQRHLPQRPRSTPVDFMGSASNGTAAKGEATRVNGFHK